MGIQLSELLRRAREVQRARFVTYYAEPKAPVEPKAQPDPRVLEIQAFVRQEFAEAKRKRKQLT